MQLILQTSLIIVSILLIISILLQQRGTGVGGLFGGGGGEVYRTKRGMEKTLFTLTIILSILFLGLTLAMVIL